MAVPSVQQTDFSPLNPALLSPGTNSSMKLNKLDKDIPLGINAKGSLIELAHKLKWAHKHFGDKHSAVNSKAAGENELHHGKVSMHVGPWLNGSGENDLVYNPNEYVIQNMYNEGRPHPLLAYGQSLFQNALQGEPCNYTSLGTVHNFNDTRNKPTSNGFLPFSAAAAMNDSLHAELDVDDTAEDPDQDMDTSEHFKEPDNGQMPLYKDEELGRFITEHWHTLNMKPTMNGVTGPSLWSLISATKEIRDLEYNKMLQTFKLQEEDADEVTDENVDKDDPTGEDSDGQLNNLDEHTSGTAMEGVEGSSESPPCSSAQDAEMDVANTEPIDKDPITVIRDRLTEPLTDLEMSAISSSALDFVVRNKVPMRVLSQLYAMQARHRRNLELRANPHEPQSRKSVVSNDGCLRKYQCPNCSYQTDNKSHLRRHVSSVHFIGMPYYCYKCSKEFPRSEKVKAHFSKVHPEVIYDHRLVRKDKFFGVDYSPESTAIQDSKLHKSPEISSQSESAAIKLTPKNMRTAGSNTPTKAMTSCSISGDSPLPTFLSSTCSSNASFASPSEISPKAGPSSQNIIQKPMWKSATKTEGERRFYCPACPYTGKDIWHLKRHYNDVHQQRKDLKCPMCTYSTGRKHRLVSHMKNHGQLFCFHCDFSTEDLITFQSHVKVCSMAQRRAQHQCSRCDRACTNRKQLQDHQYREHGAIMFCCEKCMYYSEDNAEYEQHLQQHADRQEDGYVCQVCNQVLHDYKALRHHLSTHKQPLALAATDLVKKEDIGAPDKDGEPLLECPSCDFKTQEFQLMREHKALHDTKKLMCNITGCDFQTVWPLSLEHHKKIKHLASPSSLEKSSVVATPKPPGKGTFVCPVCKDNRPPFRYKRSFEKHMAQHKQDEEKCPLCPQVFYFRASLKDHLKLDHQARVIEVSSSEESSSEDEDDDDEDDDEDQAASGPGTNRHEAMPKVKPLSQGAAMEAYGPGAILHGSMAPFL